MGEPGARIPRYAPAAIAIIALAAVVGLSRSSGTAPATGQNMRQAIDETIARETAGLDTEAKVDAYLDQLEARAQSQGKVTALEIEPGLDAIQRLSTKLSSKQLQEKQARFSSRMERLQSELQSNGRN